jgi:hypothetical protein
MCAARRPATRRITPNTRSPRAGTTGALGHRDTHHPHERRLPWASRFDRKAALGGSAPTAAASPGLLAGFSKNAASYQHRIATTNIAACAAIVSTARGAPERFVWYVIL